MSKGLSQCSEDVPTDIIVEAHITRATGEGLSGPIKTAPRKGIVVAGASGAEDRVRRSPFIPPPRESWVFPERNYMKVVASALVFIAGAAVVLWFGNTLNSWVLGGLIGGLAALLLSVPISLTLFSYLSRRHDEQLRAEAELAETEFSEVYGAYAETPARTLRGTYDAEGYALQEGTEEFWDEEEEYYHPQRALPRPTARNLPVPVPQRLIEQSPVINRLPANRQGTRAPLPRPATRNVPAVRGKDGTGRRTTRNMNNYPGSPGYEPA